MPDTTRIVAPGPVVRSVKTPQGEVLYPPADWILVPPGDPALTRRAKAAGPTWQVQEKKGRKLFSRGLWAPAERIAQIQQQLEAERALPSYQKKLEADGARREKKQAAYVEDFAGAVRAFLAFDPRYTVLADRLAEAVTRHATPVGSGTVARTQRIPIEQRAEAAVIAWMRHQTTAYDSMKIARVKGKRREVRRMLAETSRRTLLAYREGKDRDPATCPLMRAIETLAEPQAE